jgi:hypothetical protein
MLAVFANTGFPPALYHKSSWPYLSGKPLGDDTFYMLQIARELASGAGFRTPYGLPTTGVQPLMTLIYALIHLASSMLGVERWWTVRFVLILNGLLFITFCALMVAIAKREDVELSRGPYPLLVGILALFSFFGFRTFLFGLETSLYLVGLCVFILAWIPPLRTDADVKLWVAPGANIGRGVLAGALSLIRIDFLVILATYLVLSLRAKVITIWAAVTQMGIALLITAPWFVWVFHVTGSIIPSSGAAQADLASLHQIHSRLGSIAVALIEVAVPVVPILGRWPLALCAFALACAFYLMVRRVGAKVKLNATVARFGAAVVPLVLIYGGLFWATHFYARYWSPLVILALLWWGKSIAALLNAECARKKLIGTGYAILGTMIVFAVACWYSLHTGREGGSHAVAAGFIEEKGYEPSTIGAFQSGIIGYFHRGVVNLDGKLDHQALHAIKEKRLHRYIDEMGLKILIDWPEYLATLPEEWRREWISCGYIDGGSICLRRDGRPPSAEKREDGGS